MAGTKKRKSHKGKHRTAAQKAATARMIAANRARRGGGGGGRKRKGSKRAKHSHSLASLAKTVHAHSQFIAKQKVWNAHVRDGFAAIYQHVGIAGPSSMRRLSAR